MRDETTFVADAHCRKPESCGGNACNVGIIGCSFARVAAVFHQASLRTGLLPEITATGALQFIEQLVIFRAKDWLGFGGRRHNCGHSAGKRNCRSSACEPLEEPSPREIPIMLLHTPMLTDVFQWILPGNQTRNYLDSVHALYIIAGNSQICILKA